MKNLGAKTSQQVWLDALKGDVEPWEINRFYSGGDSTDMQSAGGLVFGTGGIRCLMGIGPSKMNTITVGQVTQGLANWLAKACTVNVGSNAPCIAIVYDTRIHSVTFARKTACVLAANGFSVLLFASPQPTPLLSFTVRKKKCVAGVCITASHNPREWNGYKVYDADGVQAIDAMAHGIQRAIAEVDPFTMVKTVSLSEALRRGKVTWAEPDMVEAYHGELIAQRLGVDCSGLCVVYSPLNGTGLTHAVRLFNALGVNHSVVQSQADPDGSFPKCPKPNPEDPDALAEGMSQLKRIGADIFLATDPDADRLGVVCAHKGRTVVLSGDEMGLLLLDFVLRHRTRQSKAGNSGVVVTTIVTSPLINAIAQVYGVEVRRTLTGFKYIGEQIGLVLKEGKEFLLGIEESDGYLRGTYVRDKDGLNALVLACELASYYKSHGKDLVQALDDLYLRYGYVMGRHLSIDFKDSSSDLFAEQFMGELRRFPPNMIAGKAVVYVVDHSDNVPASDVLEWELDGGSRVVIRPSGTEPKIKAYVFAAASERIEAEQLLDKLCEGLRAHACKINGGLIK